jgi:hypothetical protein
VWAHHVLDPCALNIRASWCCPVIRASHAPKWFAAAEVIRLAADQVWLHKATKEISKYWRHKREQRQSPAIGDLETSTWRCCKTEQSRISCCKNDNEMLSYIAAEKF